jgi:hypothetical protein
MYRRIALILLLLGPLAGVARPRPSPCLMNIAFRPFVLGKGTLAGLTKLIDEDSTFLTREEVKEVINVIGIVLSYTLERGEAIPLGNLLPLSQQLAGRSNSDWEGLYTVLLEVLQREAKNVGSTKFRKVQIP